MKKTLTLIGLAAICTGCNSINFTQTRPDGSSVTIKATRVLWATESYTVTFNTNGATMTAHKSTGDSAAIEAAAAGIVRGMKSP